MKVYVRDLEYIRDGLPAAALQEARVAILYYGRSVNVTPTLFRRVDGTNRCGWRLIHFEGRQTIWIAKPSIFVVFEVEDVKLSLVRRLRSHMYHWLH